MSRVQDWLGKYETEICKTQWPSAWGDLKDHLYFFTCFRVWVALGSHQQHSQLVDIVLYHL